MRRSLTHQVKEVRGSKEFKEMNGGPIVLNWINIKEFFFYFFFLSFFLSPECRLFKSFKKIQSL